MDFCKIKLSRNLCGWIFYLGFSLGAAIAITFDCFYVLPKVSDIHLLTIFDLFFTFLFMKCIYDTLLHGC